MESISTSSPIRLSKYIHLPSQKQWSSSAVAGSLRWHESHPRPNPAGGVFKQINENIVEQKDQIWPR